MVEVPSTKDLTQRKEKLEIPVIRVWCHPHRIGKSGDDYYKVFGTFSQALAFIKRHREAEKVPLIAFRGRELNLWALGIKS